VRDDKLLIYEVSKDPPLALGPQQYPFGAAAPALAMLQEVGLGLAAGTLNPQPSTLIPQPSTLNP